MHSRLAFVGVEIFNNFWFLCNNLGSKYARKSVKGSKDSDDSNICKATTVTHTKRIDRNLLETSFVCNTSSVLRKSRHMKQKEKITYCC